MSTETLRAEHLTDGWTVVDPDGGRWWPSPAAEALIEASETPEDEALRICAETPHLGTWHS